MQRRQFLQPLGTMAAQEGLPPVRAIVRGPKFHWFGYYDRLQFYATGRYLLCNEVGFEHCSTTAGNTIRIGIMDLGETRDWNWRQGCMLRLRPGTR